MNCGQLIDAPTAYYYEIQRGDPPCGWEAKLSFTKPEAPEVFRNVVVYSPNQINRPT